MRKGKQTNRHSIKKLVSEVEDLQKAVVILFKEMEELKNIK